MPELPEVERARRVTEAVAEGRVIAKARVADDPLVFAGVGPRKMQRTLSGRRIVGVHRKGKHLWLELERPPHLLLHFGMTGAIVLPSGTAVELVRAGRSPRTTWPPPHWKLVLELDDQGALAFTNARRFGRVRLRRDPLHEPPLSELGFDPLDEMPDRAGFRRALEGRRSSLKALLLDQSFAAGVGNWVADEVLHEAGLDPRRTVDSLDEAEVGRLRTALRKVITRAVKADADPARFPAHWLFHHRWERNPTTHDGRPIRFETIAGRTTAWVPAHQH